MLKRKHSRLSLLSLLLSVAMLLSCLTIVMIPASAEGATYDDDAAAVAAEYYFRLNGKYYKNLVDAHLDVADGDTIYMLADYTNNATHENVGKGVAETKTYTIHGGGHTYSSTVTHGLHFYRANVTIDNMNYVAQTGNVSGMRVECTATITLKNCTFEKVGSSANDWNTPVIVYGTLILDENAILKNNGENAGTASHGVFLEGKDESEVQKAGEIIPKLILKSNATIEAKQNVIHESTKSEIQIQSPEVNLMGAVTRRSVADTTVIMSGPTAEELEDATATEKWKTLYKQMGQEWGTVDVAQIGETKYSTLTAAFRAATDGCTIQLLTNIALDGTVIFAPDTAVNFTLDGAGFTISGGDFTLLSLGANVTCTMKNITFQNGNGGGTGTLDLAGANVTLDNGTVIRNSGGTAINNSNYVGVSVSKNGAKLTINENALIDVVGTALKSDGFSSDITINGGTVKTAYRGYVTNSANVSLTVNGGTFTTTCTSSQYLIYCWGSTGSINFNGGTISTNGANLFNAGSGKISPVIKGGTFAVGSKSYTANCLEEYSLSLNDDIGINFYAAISDSAAKLTATLPNGTEVVLTLSDATVDTKALFGLPNLNVYRFTVNVSAADMTAEIPVTLEAAGNPDSRTVSVVGYASELLAGDCTDSIRELVTAMLHYGAAAQTYFGKDTDHLANAELTAPDFTDITVADTYAPSVTGSADGLSYYGTSLLLKGKTVIRHYFRLADGKNIADYTFKLGEETLLAKQYQETNLWYVEITGIKSSELSNVYTVTVGDMTVAYSAMSYAYTVLSAEEPDEALVPMVQALVNYANAAKAHFTTNN